MKGQFESLRKTQIDILNVKSNTSFVHRGALLNIFLLQDGLKSEPIH